MSDLTEFLLARLALCLDGPGCDGYSHSLPCNDTYFEALHTRVLPPATSVEPGCTCGGMAACQQCQDRDAYDTDPALPDLLAEARKALPACRLGPTEHDGSRFCHEHVGRVHPGSPTPWQCDRIGERDG